MNKRGKMEVNILFLGKYVGLYYESKVLKV